jgi:hypothetical protein
MREQFALCADTLAAKGIEYSTAEDKLHNFKVAGALEGITVAQAIAGMMAKHTVSIYDMVPNAYSYSLMIWNEKITDHINYLVLLKAALLDEMDTTVAGYVTPDEYKRGTHA